MCICGCDMFMCMSYVYGVFLYGVFVSVYVCVCVKYVVCVSFV